VSNYTTDIFQRLYFAEVRNFDTHCIVLRQVGLL
jgi:hypothetical protein